MRAVCARLCPGVPDVATLRGGWAEEAMMVRRLLLAVSMILGVAFLVGGAPPARADTNCTTTDYPNQAAAQRRLSSACPSLSRSLGAIHCKRFLFGGPECVRET